MSDENEQETGGRKKEKVKKDFRQAAPINPEPHNASVFEFLVSLFESGFPEKITLAACYGPAGMRLGPTVREIQFKANEDKPNSEALVTMTNLILRLAQEDCDVLGKSTSRYAVLAWDLARSPSPYGRKVFVLHPSGTSQMLEEQRGNPVLDDEENGVLPTKLMLSLLDQERKDKRWLMETVANLVSGVTERDSARIERLEQAHDSVFERSVKYIAATEQMLNQAEDRKRLAKAAEFRQKMMEEGWEWIKGFGPAIQTYLSKGKHGIVEGLEGFVKSLGPELEAALLGEWKDGECIKRGILDPEQVQFIAGILDRKIDPKRLPEMANTLRPEQMVEAQQLLGEQRIMALGAIIRSATDVANQTAATS